MLDAGLPLGVLPLGTANDFTRFLGIADLLAAVDVNLTGHTKKPKVAFGKTNNATGRRKLRTRHGDWLDQW